jgi:hypothetical protein
MEKTISLRLYDAMKTAYERLTPSAIKQVKDFVASQPTVDGFFTDKGGNPDVYYTTFGWLLSLVFDVRVNVKQSLSRMDSIDYKALDLVHYAAYMRCCMILAGFGWRAWRVWFRSALPPELRALNSFDVVPNGDKHSPYSSVIWYSLHEDSGDQRPDKDALLRSLEAYHIDGRGYTNITDSREPTVNATCAALSVRGQIEGYQRNADVDALYEMQESNGGFKATPASACPDILSTATALFTLACYGVKPKYPPLDFINAHWLPDGGFSPTAWDNESDVEYTFYGLLALSYARDANK